VSDSAAQGYAAEQAKRIFQWFTNTGQKVVISQSSLESYLTLAFEAGVQYSTLPSEDKVVVAVGLEE
jgi:hypothetical protein